MKKVSSLFFLFIISFSWAQNTFEPEEFMWYVKNYHPIVKQSSLLEDRGENSIRRAKGNFDPYLFGYSDNKQFENKNYYQTLNAGLKVPTWYGLEFKTGLDRNNGLYINPENTLPSGGLLYGGVSASIGQGLFIDKRRAQLRQAKIYNESTVFERQKIINDLLYESFKTYWKWVEAYNQFKVYEESLLLAEQRFNAVKQNYIFGDSPAIDTLEAYIQLQSRELSRNQYKLLYQNSTLELSNYLWYENDTPLEITDSLTPPSFDILKNVQQITINEINQFIHWTDTIHPEIILYNYKIESLKIENKLYKEFLKPTLNINYNLLNEPIGNNYFNQLSTQNYKWGLEFSFPIFIRKQRADLNLSKIKISETTYNKELKTLEVKNKTMSYYNEQQNLVKQLELFNSTTKNYKQLLDAEKEKFTLGESSLFLINSRELYYIDALLKLIEINCKSYINNASILWSMGQLK